MCLVIVFLPLIGSIFSGLFGRYVGRIGSVFISILCMIVTTIIALYEFYQFCLAKNCFFILLGSWIQSSILVVNWGFMFDSLSLSMLAMVSIVSTVVHIYASSYMKGDPHLSRFMSYLSLFTFFMFILVTSDNFIQLFLGWEGVGVCSYLLINFWFTRVQANKSAIKALIMNRIGDFGLLIGILLIFYFFSSLDFSFVFSLTPYFVGIIFKFINIEFSALFLISLFLFIGSMGKSAQIGLHTWLPDAMEGPTPVSALIHAATMVTAGVFLIIRCSLLFEYASDTLLIITIIGSLTAFFASTVGIVQNDIKKVIAYSTCSQLGYMIFACGVSAYNSSFFHLINHAFFKALLFLGSGIIIHALNNEQDMRRMGGLIKILPYTYAVMFIGSLALAGFPYLSGFYSKDNILESSYANYELHSIFAYILGSFSAFFTAFYSIRLLFLSFLAPNNQFKWNIKKLHEGDVRLSLPLLLLIFGSLFSGYFLKDLYIGFGSIFFDNSIFILSTHFSGFDLEFIPLIIKLIPTIFTITGFVLSFLFYNSSLNTFITKSIIRVYIFLSTKWFFDSIYNNYIGYFMLDIGYNIFYKVLDKGMLEFLGATRLSNLINNLAKQTTSVQTGLLYHYLCYIFLTFIIFIVFFDYYAL